MTPSVLMLEFNELSPTLMDRFIADGHLPAFARLRDQSATFITEAGEEEGRLNPWVQWVTVHTGATASEHGIAKLGEAAHLQLPTIADAVTAAGGSVWLCGSMNVQPIAPVTGGFLPDPWSIDAVPQPVELAPFFRFVSANVQEHTSEEPALTKRDALAFVRFLVSHGLSVRTAAATVRQLVGERVGQVGRWQRAELLDRFQWDVFAYYLRRLRPMFATFFSNSTAHFQHLYWNELEHDAPNSAVLDGYRQMDRLVHKALALAGEDDVTVVLCTALSQTANYDEAEYEGFYRPRKLDALVEQLALIDVVDTAPMMAEQSHLFFADDAAAAEGERVLRSVSAGTQQAFDVRRSGTDVVIGARFFARRPAGTILDRPDGRTVSFDELFYWTDSPREGTHHPDGIFWIQGARSEQPGARVPLIAVAPTLLALLGVERPGSMDGDVVLAGRCD